MLVSFTLIGLPLKYRCTNTQSTQLWYGVRLSGARPLSALQCQAHLPLGSIPQQQIIPHFGLLTRLVGQDIAPRHNTNLPRPSKQGQARAIDRERWDRHVSVGHGRALGCVATWCVTCWWQRGGGGLHGLQIQRLRKAPKPVLCHTFHAWKQLFSKARVHVPSTRLTREVWTSLLCDKLEARYDEESLGGADSRPPRAANHQASAPTSGALCVLC